MVSVNLIGWPNLTAGIGQHMRSVASALVRAGIEFEAYDVLPHCFKDISIFSNTEEQLSHYLSSLPLVHNVSLHCLNLNHLLRLPDDYYEKPYNIGYGYYEMSYLMDEFAEGAEKLDEIWAPTQFVQSVISQRVDIPVVHVPIPLEIVGERKDVRKRYNLASSSFWFYSSFDARSLIERKNPFAAIAAFQKAFGNLGGNVGLVVKVNSSEDSDEQKSALKELRQMVAGDHRVKLLNVILSREETLDLLYSVDCYISLHRAEGLGLGMSEAMSLGTPVIATGYSGNLEFMNSRNSELVGYEYVVDKTCEKIRNGFEATDQYFWADADVNEAAEKMRKLFLDGVHRKKLADRARSDLHKFYSLDKIAALYRRKLDRIGHGLAL